MSHPETSMVWTGERAIADYLNPERQPPTPLVELPSGLNPFRAAGVRIFAKLHSATPLANVKSLPAYHMLDKAERSGRLKGVSRIIENSSGNTAYSLAIIGRWFGVPEAEAFVSHEVSPGKLALLRLFGIRPRVNIEAICPDPSDRNSGIHKARLEANSDSSVYNPGQYDNEANPAAHERWTGPQLWRQTEGRLRMLAVGLGTTGTCVGTSRYLKAQEPATRVIGVVRAPNNPVPGVRTRGLLRMIAFDWCGHVDAVREVGTCEAYRRSLAMCRLGLLAGPSSGFALQGLLDEINELSNKGELDALRDDRGEVTAAFVCCDTPFPYVDEYFEYLDESDFPEIEHPERLTRARQFVRIRPSDRSSDGDINCTDLHHLIESGHALRIIDIRDSNLFEDHHIPGSQSIPWHNFVERHVDIEEELVAAGDPVVVVCRLGRQSVEAAALLRAAGVDARSLVGGMTEWSRVNGVRIRPERCRKLS